MRYLIETFSDWLLWVLYGVRINIAPLKKDDIIVCYVHTAAVSHAFLHTISSYARDMKRRGFDFSIVLFGHNVDVEHTQKRIEEFKADMAAAEEEHDELHHPPRRPRFSNFEGIN